MIASPEQGKDHKRLREDIDVSDNNLAALVAAWVRGAWPDDEVKRTFITQELESRLASYRRKARLWRTTQIAVWLLLALLGLVIAVLAGFKTGRAVTIVAGALVATLTTLTNAMRPGTHADGFDNGRLALRDESWLLLNRRGDYATLDDEGRFDHFAEAISGIVQTKRSLTSLSGIV